MDGYKTSVNEIARLHAEMRDLTIESGVKGKRYDKFLDHLDGLSYVQLEELHSWYEGVLRVEYHDVLEIKRLLPQAVWDRYRDMGESDLREQILLSERQIKLRKVWNARRKPKREVAHVEEESTESKRVTEAPDGSSV